MKHFRLSLFPILVFIMACQDNPAEQSSSGDKASSNDSIAASDFDQFYERFHNDSAFQLSHILFPLDGLPAEEDSMLIDIDHFKWEKKEWVLHKPFNDNLVGFDRALTRYDNNLVVESIRHEDAGFHMERRFAQMDDQWMLIYYAGLRR